MRSAFNVLLVEDDAADAELTIEAFSESKFQVNFDIVRDGHEAISHLKRQSEHRCLPDLIFLDLNLPGK